MSDEVEAVRKRIAPGGGVMASINRSGESDAAPLTADVVAAARADRALPEHLVEAIRKDAIFHVAGAGGHSQIPAMEMFYRAGGGCLTED